VPDKRIREEESHIQKIGSPKKNQEEKRDLQQKSHIQQN
jgi:hypothetical protein